MSETGNLSDKLDNEAGEVDELGAELAAVPELPTYPGLDPRWEGHTHTWPDMPDELVGVEVECVECGLKLPAIVVYADHDAEREAVRDGG